MSKSDLSLSPTIDLQSFSPVLPQQELLLGAGARLKYRGRVRGQSRDGDGVDWQNLTLAV